MSGPWDTYAAKATPQQAQTAGPWSQYAQASAPSAPAAAGAAPTPDSGGLLNPADHPMLKSATDLIPAAGGVIGGLAGAAGGSIVPGAGTVAGELGGAAVGQATGSVVKDAINSWVFGEKKSLGDVAKDATIEGGIGGLTQGAGVALGAGAKAVAATKVGSAVLDAAGTAASKVGEAIFRVPSEVIKRYATAGAEIAKMSADADGSVAAASDTVKEGFVSSLKEFRTQLGDQIGSALSSSKETVSAEPIIDNLTAYKNSLNKTLNGKEISEISDMINKTKVLAGLKPEVAPASGAAGDLASFLEKMTSGGAKELPSAEAGKIPVSSAHELKQYLQGLAEYGQTAVGDRASAAAKQAAYTTRKLINQAVPEVAAANNQLAALHTIQNKMVKSLLTPGAAESGLVAAGKGANERNLVVLQKLSKLTGQDFVGPAQNLGAMKELGGASFKKAGIGALAGGALGYEADGEKGALAGATLGAAVTSPIILKKGLDLARGLAPVANSAIGNNTLGQAVMHGSGAVSAIRKQE